MNTSINIVPRSVWQNPIHFIAFGFGSGAMPYAPGTFGSLMGIPFYLILCQYSLLTYAIILTVAIIIGFWLCDKTAKDVNVHDHPGIVWDEIVGFNLTMIAVPVGLFWVIGGFILFRIFDIWKPWPISWANHNIRNGFGIVLDDLMAAVPAWVILQICAWLVTYF